MSIGTTIKKLRREKDITQEQLAEYLGISSRAVSQWECEKTCPDISQLPVLAGIFDVSADVLLGIDVERKEEQIEKIIKDSRALLEDGDSGKSLEILREGLRKYPASHKLMLSVASAIISMVGCNDAVKLNEAIELCEKVLEKSTDDEIRHKAIMFISSAYYSCGNRAEAMRNIEKLPSVKDCREVLITLFDKGKEGFKRNQEYINLLYNMLLTALITNSVWQDDNDKPIYSKEEKISIGKQILSVVQAFFPNGDYFLCSQFGDLACRTVAEGYVECGDYESALEWFEKAADFAIHFDTYDNNAVHTSLPIKNVKVETVVREIGKTRCGDIINQLMTTKELESLKNTTRFENLVERLKAVK